MSAFDRELENLTFDDVSEGDRFDLGQWQMDREEVLAFASKYDPQPYHMSEQATVGHPIFARMAASGWHTVMVTQLMLSRMWESTKVRGLAGGGVEHIQWIAPVYPGDRLTGEFTVSMLRRSRSRPERGLMTMDVILSNQDGAKVLTLAITGVFLA